VLSVLGLGVAAGYLMAGWWWGGRDTTSLAQICARVGYINGLQQELGGQQAASEEVREQFNELMEACRLALKNRGEESD
jgi:hypothetical protein